MNTVYAFEWCSCVYESAFEVASLHSTKRGAVREMARVVNLRWIEQRAHQARNIRQQPLANEAWRVRALAVEHETPNCDLDSTA